MTPFTKDEAIFDTVDLIEFHKLEAVFLMEVQVDEAPDLMEDQIFNALVFKFVRRFFTPFTRDETRFDTVDFMEFQMFEADVLMEFQLLTVQVFADSQIFLKVSGSDLNQSTMASQADLTAEATALTLFLNDSDSL